MSQETTNKAGGVSFIGLLGLVIGATIASAVFAFPGDFAAAGAGSGAVLVGWLITGIGMLGLCLAFYYLNKLKPELKAAFTAMPAPALVLMWDLTPHGVIG